MKALSLLLTGAFILSAIGCYPAYPPPQGYASAPDAKGYSVQQDDPLPPPPGPRMVGVDPALLVAGAAAAGLIGYAIGHNHHHHHYAPVPYGYYGPRYYYR